jgi:ribose/xylose/arabinose/galactoside ABC-type transport system permease subunit
MSRFAIKMPVVCLLIGTVAGAAIAYAAQPNMVNALGSLQAARAELVRATANKGGHRDRAIKLVDQAIGETQAGISYAGG